MQNYGISDVFNDNSKMTKTSQEIKWEITKLQYPGTESISSVFLIRFYVKP